MVVPYTRLIEARTGIRRGIARWALKPVVHEVML